MGNIIQNEQFKERLQELLQNKKFKRTLKIIYKENQKQLLSVQSCQIIDQLTLQQCLDLKKGIPFVLEHQCKILLDIKEKQRYCYLCTLCNKKVKRDRGNSFCPTCNEQTQYKLGYCLKVKIVDAISEDNQNTHKAIMFEETANNYLGIEANDFSNQSHDSQNEHFISINDQKSHIVHLLKLQYNLQNENFIINKILPLITE
ncbi:unnamed protein product [Paramecium pentaurelia]|uniref:Replication factor A C-terminal domain-containing protein n=1 Tax=Paramecium pentaurelia TaxID=43138 RepID=A0A8S1W3K4_9CILI|nr:unnamed protein product [Paramecium pentaurelia]